MIEKLLAITFSLLILLQAGIIRSIVGTWIFPACLFSLFWFAYTFIPLVFLFEIPVESLSVAFIFLCCTTFSLTSFFFNWKKAFSRNKSLVRVSLTNDFMVSAFYILSAFSLIFLLINTLIQGFSLNQIIFNLMDTSSEYMARRYTDNLSVSIFGQMSVVLTYTAAIIGGLIYPQIKKKSSQISVIICALTPSILVMLIQAAKGMLFLSIVFFAAGVLISKLRNHDLKLITKSSIRQFFIYGLLIFPALITSFMARGLYETTDFEFIKNELIRYFASYSSAHLYAFSDWFSYFIGNTSVINYNVDASGYGFFTFMSIFKLFGSTRIVESGIYTEYYFYGDLIQSNIFTIFRGLIIDFGLLGSIIFMLGFGFFLNFSFNKLLNSYESAINISIFIHSMGYFYTSFIISLLIWNSIYGSFVLVILILSINNNLNNATIHKRNYK